MRRSLLLLLLVVAGCGGGHQVAVRQAPAKNPRICRAAAPGFRTCFKPGIPSNPTIERRAGSGWTVLAGPLKHPDALAEWGPEVWVSPDRQTLLAEWHFPCDSAVTVFLPLRGGTPRVVTGQLDWRKAPISRALGWTRDGEARVSVFGKRGVQLIDPHALRRVRVHPTRC
jgi:hypothetical protein